MKPKTASAGKGRPPKHKVVKKEVSNEDVLSVSRDFQISMGNKPSVEIAQCISYQKFRYSGENRPGKKYQEKEFMTLKLSNLCDKVVRTVIICADAENQELIHPNGLVGRDCHNGIYDKDYCITKSPFIIKIPYLRTERIKTKKNEHKKIQSVLQERAMHLPTPYKERCLSQCTDNYTANRKFDTTKVCLGVIVTVLSHQGIFNGSLHAISHVVRSASEKTKMGILKLSERFICAATGGDVDIFTSQEGPDIEPEKFEVSVSCEVNGNLWVSDKFVPEKEDILYKKVIRYTIPPYAPNHGLENAVPARLHLECPQSNQFCEIFFNYGPQGDFVMIDQHNHLKRQIEDENTLHFSPKRMRLEMTEGDRSMEAIKANLKTKLKAKQVDFPNSRSEVVSLGQTENTHQYILSQAGNVAQDSFEQQVLVTHHNPQTGESSVLLDMDNSNKPSSNNTNGVVVVNGDTAHYSIPEIPMERLNNNSIKQIIQSEKREQDVQVVATGYSDAVPPNTTVYIYTTNGNISESGEAVRIEDTPGEPIVLQEVTDEESIMITDACSGHATSQGKSEQIVRREALVKVPSGGKEQSYIIVNSTSEHPIVSSTASKDAINHKLETLGSSSSPARFSTVSSSPSAIPSLRRMLIPHKVMSASPWEVGGEDDSSQAYNMISNDFTPVGVKPVYQSPRVPISVKKEPEVSGDYTEAENAGSQQVNIISKGKTLKSEEDPTSEKLPATKNSTSELTPMEFHLTKFVASNATVGQNLPTLQVADFVDDLNMEKVDDLREAATSKQTGVEAS